ncbi:hypothetical protein JCM33374_g4634 [Metschnikowia sp. JCM 33374]|nr:hypothetical protein JCM33374_g4634 [Metschnikowia sp. JCM 33374]
MKEKQQSFLTEKGSSTSRLSFSISESGSISFVYSISGTEQNRGNIGTLPEHAKVNGISAQIDPFVGTLCHLFRIPQSIAPTSSRDHCWNKTLDEVSRNESFEIFPNQVNSKRVVLLHQRNLALEKYPALVVRCILVLQVSYGPTYT